MTFKSKIISKKLSTFFRTRQYEKDPITGDSVDYHLGDNWNWDMFREREFLQNKYYNCHYNRNDPYIGYYKGYADSLEVWRKRYSK